MIFTSYSFLFVFLPLVLLCYCLLRRTPFVNWLLAAASLLFYAFTGVLYLIPLLFTCILDYYVGQHIAPTSPFRYKKVLLTVSLVIQLGLLCVLKYAGWVTKLLSGLATHLHLATTLPIFTLLLPPGISFYTFHTISYTVDIYRGKFKPHNKLIDYITFVTFFPQLVAGPIARASSLLPQIAAKRSAITWTQAEEAFWLISWGVFKKITLADNAGHLVERIGEVLKLQHVSSGAGLFFAYAFALQIYCDFSAYTDIARGVAKLFHIELSRNFLTPYAAVSPTDFWRRWHISLSSWLRDYLYIPLGGNQHGILKTVRNLFITMTLGGLWHGAGLRYMIWGVYHGILLAFYRLLPLDEILVRHLGERWGKRVSIVIMLHLVCLGWIIFRAEAGQLSSALHSIAALLSGHAMDNHFFIDIGYGLLLFGLPVLVTEYVGYVKGIEFVDVARQWHWTIRALLYVIIFYAVVVLGAREQSAFIYFQF